MRDKITAEQAFQTFIKQKGKCFGCGKEITLYSDSDADWANLEHSHKDLRFRGWSCWVCNQIIGLAHDDPKLLRKLATYIS